MKQLFLLCMLWIWYPAAPDACDLPVAYRFHEDARTLLDSLESSPTEANLFDRMVLAHNLAFNKYDAYLGRSDRYLKQFVEDSGWTTAAEVYRQTIEILHIRDAGLKNTAKGAVNFLSLGLFSNDPRDDARQKIKSLGRIIKFDSLNPTYHIHRLTAAVESADILKEVLADASTELVWFKAHPALLDSAEIFLYRLSWAKYAYRYVQTHDNLSTEKKIEELNKGLDWLEHAFDYVCSAGQCRDWDIWDERFRMLRMKLITGGG